MSTGVHVQCKCIHTVCNRGEGIGDLWQINTCRRVPLLVNFKKSRHLGFGVFIDIWSMALCNGSTGLIFSFDEWGILTAAASANIILLSKTSGSLVGHLITFDLSSTEVSLRRLYMYLQNRR
jgi:hypothetical protein